MRIAVHSDLHTEFGWVWPEGFLSDSSYDVLIIAGDFSNVDVFEDNLKRLKDKAPDKTVLMVFGNHDFYAKKMKFDVALESMKEVCLKNGVYPLYRACYEAQGVRVVGCTGWPNMRSVKGFTDDMDKMIVEKAISDFSWIKGWGVDRMVEEAEEDYNYIHTLLKIPHPKTVVVTHFPPSLLLNSDKYPISTLTNYFHNDYPEFFEMENKPIAWIYGHTHFGVNREVNGVRCISNQHGYLGEYTEYSPNLIIEV